MKHVVAMLLVLAVLALPSAGQGGPSVGPVAAGMAPASCAASGNGSVRSAWASPPAVMAIGDSMSDGTWPPELARRLGVPLVSPAKYAAGARQIYRVGAEPVYLTVVGNTLPEGGKAVAVTTINDAPPGPDNPASFLNTFAGDTVTVNNSLVGTLAGRRVTVSIPTGGSAAYTVAADPGQPTAPVPPGSLFVPDHARHLATAELWIWLSQNYFWNGRDDANAELVYHDIARILARTCGQRVLIFGLLPEEGWIRGSAGYRAVRAFNAGLRARWPAHYVEVRGQDTLRRMLASGNGSAQDRADVANGIVPRSLRRDGLHLNAAGQAVIAQLAFEFRAIQRLPVAAGRPASR